MAFLMVAGHPALDLVNTLDWRFRRSGPEELLKTYDDLLGFSEQSRILSPKQARDLRRSVNPKSGAQALALAGELREALAEAFYAPFDSRTPAAASRATLERCFQLAYVHRRISWDRAPGLAWTWSGMERDAQLPCWILSIGALDLLTSEAIHQVRECDNPECRWLFLDTSKNHTKRWCDMKVCGNRMKARRFKAQHRA
jgi:predicted RNA-binding Zn ribbon-like protein